jgi:hypothetical protein
MDPFENTELKYNCKIMRMSFGYGVINNNTNRCIYVCTKVDAYMAASLLDLEDRVTSWSYK